MLQVIESSDLREQILALVGPGGLSLRDACDRLLISEELADKVLRTRELSEDDNKTKTRNLIDNLAPKVVQALASIGLDESLENIGARVSALKCLAELHRDIDEQDKENLDQFKETVNKMREIVDKRLSKLTVSESRVNIIDVRTTG